MVVGAWCLVPLCFFYHRPPTTIYHRPSTISAFAAPCPRDDSFAGGKAAPHAPAAPAARCAARRRAVGVWDLHRLAAAHGPAAGRAGVCPRASDPMPWARSADGISSWDALRGAWDRHGVFRATRVSAAGCANPPSAVGSASHPAARLRAMVSSHASARQAWRRARSAATAASLPP